VPAAIDESLVRNRNRYIIIELSYLPLRKGGVEIKEVSTKTKVVQ